MALRTLPLFYAVGNRLSEALLIIVFLSSSGIFGYINYLVEKDRKFILDTLINGT